MEKSKIMVLVALVAFSVLASGVFAGVGVSPSTIDFNGMLRSGYAERYISISNPGDDAQFVGMGAEGTIGPWITIEPSNMTLGPRSFGIAKIIVNTPSDAPNGLYKGTVLVISRQSVPGQVVAGAGVAVVSGVGVLTNVEISDVQRQEYNIEGIRVPDTEECRPIQMIASVRNTGNVRSNARFDIEIVSDDGSILKTYNWTSDEMLPTSVYTFIVRVPYDLEHFGCVPVGHYKANINAWLGDKLMYTYNLPFNVYERGTLSLSGAIAKLNVPQNITMGEIIKMDASFHNTGQLPVLAKLRAEIYKKSLIGEKKLVDTIESDQIEVNLGATETLTAYYKPGLPGDYSVKATVLFEGKTSEPVEADFRVLISDAILYGGAILAIAIIVAVAMLVRRRLKKRRG